MKILMITSSALPYDSSGVAYVVDNISKELIEFGNSVEVVTIANTFENKRYNNYNVHALKKEDFNNQLELLLDNIRPDIVHFHAIQDIEAKCVKIAKLKGYKTVITMHDWWWICPFMFMADKSHIPCNQTKLDISICNNCVNNNSSKKIDISKRQSYHNYIIENYVDLIIPVSDYLKQYILDNIKNLPEVITVPNGVENPKSVNKLIKNQNNKKVIFGFLGGRHELKGYDILIDTLNNIEHINYEVRVYGDIQLGQAALKKVIKYIKQGNIKELINKARRYLKKDSKQNIPIKYYPVFKPEEKDSVYREIDILLSLSKVKESSSLVVREALIRNIPVITTPSGGPEEVIVNGKNGIVLKDINSKELQKAMEEIIQTDNIYMMKKYITENPYDYTYKKQSREILRLYKNLR